MRTLTPQRIALALLFAALSSSGPAWSAPRPKPASNRYSLEILGFNDGEPYRVSGAAAEAILADPGARLFRFRSQNWMDGEPDGAYVPVTRVTQRYPSRSPADLVAVYRADLDGDQVQEVLLVPDVEAIADKHRYAPTILERKDDGYRAVWAASRLRGERYLVVDIRDLNEDGAPEVLLMGEAGRRGYYQFHELIGWTRETFASLPVKHVDSIHFVDLDHDGRVEVVVRERVGRRGPAYQWTYIDHLYRWDGQQFASAEDQFPRYHDEQTLPTLLGDLLDHYEAKLPILMEKVDAIKRVRASVLSRITRPDRFNRAVVDALAALQKDQVTVARRRLEELERQYGYDVQVLLALAQIHSRQARSANQETTRRRRWDRALDYAIRTLTVEPENRSAWWWAGVAFTFLRERSSAVGSFVNAVRLCGGTDEGLAFLKARRSEPGLDPALEEAIDDALRHLAPH